MTQTPMLARPVELLSVTPGFIKETSEPIVIVSLRQDLPGFQPTDLVLSVSHAERLLSELKACLGTVRRKGTGLQDFMKGKQK